MYNSRKVFRTHAASVKARVEGAGANRATRACHIARCMACVLFLFHMLSPIVQLAFTSGRHISRAEQSWRHGVTDRRVYSSNERM